jgi:hypothetical protein
VAWGVAVALLASLAGMTGVESPDLLGFAVAVLAAGLVLSARLGGGDPGAPAHGITDYT